MEFTRNYLIRFAHCDPAGIVFFPRYFDLFNDHVEDWFGEALGCGFAALHGSRRLGVPTVHLDCNFANPSRLGDRVEFALQVTRIGQASIHLRREARVGTDVRVQLNQVLACLNLDTGRALAWPDDLRDGFAPFVAAAPSLD